MTLLGCAVVPVPGARAFGAHSDPPTQTVPKHHVKAGYLLQTRGKCSFPITSLFECTRAAQVLVAAQKGVSAINDGEHAVTSDPPNCYFENEVLKFNSAMSNTGLCSSEDVCVCKVDHRKSCATSCSGKTQIGVKTKGACAAEKCDNVLNPFLSLRTFGCSPDVHGHGNDPCCDVRKCGKCENSCAGQMLGAQAIDHRGARPVCEAEECNESVDPYINLQTWGCTKDVNAPTWGNDPCCDIRSGCGKTNQEHN